MKTNKQIINYPFAKNAFSNIKECYVLGNGYTLNKFALEKMSEVFTVGVNGILLSGFEPDIICISDPLTYNTEDNLEKLLNSKCKLVLSKIASERLLNNHINPERIIKIFDVNCNPFFSHDYTQLWYGDLDYTRHAGSVIGDICFPFLIYAGVNTIYLLGIDGYRDLSNITQFHFYQGKAEQWYNILSIKDAYRFDIWMGKIDLLARINNTKIINLSPGTTREAFEKGDANAICPQFVNHKIIEVANKFIKVGNIIYKAVTPNNDAKNAISLYNVISGKFLRHYRGKLIESDKNITSKVFNDDSSFFAEISFTDKNKVSLRSSNFKKHYVVMDPYDGQFYIRKFNHDFDPLESSFNIY